MLNAVVLAFVMTTMLAMGMKLDIKRIITPLRDHRFVMRAILVNVLLTPAIALAVAVLPGVEPSLGIALLLLATAAGSPTLPKLVEIARGDPALAVSVTLLLMAVTLVGMPLMLPYALSGVSIDASAIARLLVLYTLLPLVAGLLFWMVRKQEAERLALVLGRISTLLLVLMMVLALVVHWAAMKALMFSGAAAAGLAFVVLATAGGWLFGGADRGVRKVLTLCAGQRNIGIALVVASQSFPDPRVFSTVILVTVASWIIVVPLMYALGRGNPLPLGCTGDRSLRP